MDPATVLGLGSALLMISITNFVYISKLIKKYINPKDEKSDSMNLLTKLPLHELRLISNLTLVSVPLLFVGGFMIIYGFSI